MEVESFYSRQNIKLEKCKFRVFSQHFCCDIVSGSLCEAEIKLNPTTLSILTFLLQTAICLLFECIYTWFWKINVRPTLCGICSESQTHVWATYKVLCMTYKLIYKSDCAIYSMWLYWTHVPRICHIEPHIWPWLWHICGIYVAYTVYCIYFFPSGLYENQLCLQILNF